MSLHHNAKIITDDIALNLDSFNIKSYDRIGSNWFDLSKQKNDAVLYNTSFDSIQNSIIFDASGDRAVISNYFIENPTKLTISSWFKMSAGAGTYRCVLHKNPNDTSVGGSEYWIGASAANLLVATIGARTGIGWQAGETNIPCVLNNWYNVVASWDGSVVRVYVNGVFNKQYNLSSHANNSSVTRIGASGDGGQYQVFGNISNVSIYNNRSLTDIEVKYNYDSIKGRYSL